MILSLDVLIPMAGSSGLD